MFQLRLIDGKDEVEDIAIMCINCKKETGFYFKSLILEEMIAKFVLNTILHYVGRSWIIPSNKKQDMKLTKVIITIGCKKVLGITHTFVLSFMEDCLDSKNRWI